MYLIAQYAWLFLTINVCSWVPAYTAYGISFFASFLTIANNFQTYGLLLVLLHRLKSPFFSLWWVTSLVLSSVWDIRKLNHIDCRKEIPKLKLLYKLQWSLYALLPRGCWASHIYWQDRREINGVGEGGRGSLTFVVEIAAWNMWYIWTQFLFNSPQPWHHGSRSHFLPPEPKGHWYLHQVLQQMKAGKRTNAAKKMLHNRSLDSQLKRGIKVDWLPGLCKVTIRPLSDVITPLLVLIMLQRQQLYNAIHSLLKTTFLFTRNSNVVQLNKREEKMNCLKQILKIDNGLHIMLNSRC